MFLLGITGYAGPLNRTSHTVDNYLQNLSGTWIVAYSRHPLFLPGRTGDARPFNRASNTIDYCLSARTGVWVGVCSRHQSCS
ncbi:hypothetical protein DMS87_27700 [Klebsiella variicola]|nr:hypothetical protein DMS87_27700 [Klebsiella variicola]